MGSRLVVLSFAVSFVVGCAAVAQEAPKVVSLQPPRAAEVDARTCKQLVVEFDRAMSNPGHSLCGGGPTMPKVVGQPQWRNDKTLVVDVELEPDREYSFSLNCPAAQNLRGKDGTPLAPVAWTFSTLPLELRPAAEQKKRNQRALTTLLQALASSYSHRELRVKDWKKLEKEHTPRVLAARTDRGFAAAVAAMLEPTEDLHLYFRLGEQVFGTGRRAVDSLWRRERIEQHMKVAPAGPQALAGRSADGIGYLMIAAWNEQVDPNVIGMAITELMDTKAMVIDARPNAGGDETLALQVAAWFVEGTRTYAKNRYRERAGKDGFGRVLERQITGNGENRRYAGPIVVLTSRYVMSSNESFVMMLRQAPDCVVVGQNTFGSSGNPKPVDLGNGVTALIPSWQDLQLDGTPFEGVGLAPDVAVACTARDLETRDPILERGLELLRAKIAEAK